MKQFLLFGFLTIFSGFFAYGFQNNTSISASPIQTKQSTEQSDKQNKPTVLAELYTAERCPNCPPADRNLAFFDKEQPFQQAEIITLALHVDYSNFDTRKDKFSSPIFSRRQDIYAQKFRINSIFTPQMVVDGEFQFAGGNLEKAQKAIIEAAKTQKAKVEIVRGEDKFNIKISELPKHENATVFLAIAEDGLGSNIYGTENTVAKREYTSVLRELKSLGMLGTQQNNLEIETIMQYQPSWKKENLKFIVFVQENMSRKILGVSRINLS
ncbi:MAG: DUF1223 domain-containing protein [Acidobacteria bacterium]|nr:DUF1223 domain-containing protein [Acidobacteriota bacterium]MCA1640010.1 DUF1223 domain-containing protein [Acidobacteriota bacterium]